jgi:hypothetical protein
LAAAAPDFGGDTAAAASNANREVPAAATAPPPAAAPACGALIDHSAKTVGDRGDGDEGDRRTDGEGIRAGYTLGVDETELMRSDGFDGGMKEAKRGRPTAFAPTGISTRISSRKSTPKKILAQSCTQCTITLSCSILAFFVCSSLAATPSLAFPSGCTQPVLTQAVHPSANTFERDVPRPLSC